MRQDAGPRTWCGGCGKWASARGVAAAFPVHVVNGRRCGAWQRPPMPAEAKVAHATLRRQAAARPNVAARRALRREAEVEAAIRADLVAAIGADVRRAEAEADMRAAWEAARVPGGVPP